MQKDRLYSSKFCVKDLTRSIYSVKNSEIVRETVEEFESSETNVMGYFAEISINE